MIDLIRAKNNNLGIYTVLVCVLMGVLGLFLLVSLDGYGFNDISQGLLQYSIYTVYTQFGFFILPVLAIGFITVDYREKNISFYELMKYNSVSYFWNKAVVLLIFMFVGNILVSVMVGVCYGRFNNILMFLLRLETASTFIIIISLLYGFIFKNMMTAYCVSFAIWVISIILSTSNKVLGFLCFYDASLERHSIYEDILYTGIASYKYAFEDIIYNIIVCSIATGIVFLLRNRWKKNGI